MRIGKVPQVRGTNRPCHPQRLMSPPLLYDHQLGELHRPPSRMSPCPDSDRSASSRASARKEIFNSVQPQRHLTESVLEARSNLLYRAGLLLW